MILLNTLSISFPFCSCPSMPNIYKFDLLMGPTDLYVVHTLSLFEYSNSFSLTLSLDTLSPDSVSHWTFHLTYWALNFQIFYLMFSVFLSILFHILYWLHFIQPFVFSLNILFIHILLCFIKYSYSHYCEYSEFSFNSFSVEFITTESFSGVMLPRLFIFLVFLFWDLYIWD